MQIKVKNGTTTVELDAAEKRVVTKFCDIITGLKEHAEKDWKGVCATIEVEAVKIKAEFCK